ncbi:ABC transporter permease [Rubripirellula obstinata]|nr:iron export ABC transporter permease subunit FetB [Rubripirellula obstinata]
MLSPWEVSVAALLLVVNVVVSWWLRLGLGRQIVLSAVRMVAQLSLLGLVLKQIFALASFPPVMLLAAAMTIIAGLSSISRVENRYPSIHLTAIISVWASSWLVTAVMITAIVRPTPWYAPQIVIPLLGMVLGNSLTGISLAMDRFVSELKNRRGEVEMRLSLGATRWEATREIFAASARTAMVPILNTMSVAGIVSIPGMMTGQLLAGAPPIQAVKYQIMIMFVIAAAIAIGVMIALGISFYRVTTSDHQLKL